MTGKDVYLQMTWSWPDKTWNILCSYCLQWNTSQSKFRNHYFLFLFAFSILSQLFLIWGCTYIYIYISAVKVNALITRLTQTHFNGTNFFNARLTQRVFAVWPVAQPLVGEMEMDSVANLGTLQTPLATFFPSKKRPNLVSENHRYCRASARSCSPSARTHLSLSASALFRRTPLSLSLSRSASAQRREEQGFNSVKHRYYVASLILHASIAEITAQLLSLSYVYLISSDDGAIIRIFLCRLTSWKGELVMYSSLKGSRFSHYFIFIPLSDNRNSKIYQWKQFYWEYSFIKIQYVGTERETNVIINNKCTFCIFRRRAALCAKI